MSAKTLMRGVLLFLPSLLLAVSPYAPPKSFSMAVNVYKKIDFDYRRTALTDEAYRYDPTSCMDKLYLENDPKKSVVFVRVVEEQQLLKRRRCGREKICTKFNGELYKGARCCRSVDDLYKAFDRDVMNIIPVRKDKIKELKNPPLHARGNIARVYLYINDQYGLGLSFEEQTRYLGWHQADPADEKECQMYQKVYELQDRENPWMRSSCEVLSSKSSKSLSE